MDLDHTQAGSFERRKRNWLIAISAGLRQVDINKMPSFTCQYRTLGELLEPVQFNDASCSDSTYLKDKALRDKAAGRGFATRNLVDVTSTHQHHRLTLQQATQHGADADPRRQYRAAANTD